MCIFAFQNKKNVIYASDEAKSNSNNIDLQDNEHMYIEFDSNGDKVPVPNGYVGSNATGENEIDTGYVIYEGTEEVNDGNVEEAQKTRNQYVWIPVPDASKMYGIDNNGKKWGKLYSFTTSTGNNIDPVTGAQPHNWSESNDVMKLMSNSGFREPSVITSSSVYDSDSTIKTLAKEEITKHEFLMQLEQEFNGMIESIKKYGGFYIGRYETGNLSMKISVVRKENVDIGNQTWYKMYKNCKSLKNQNTNIETGMIWGSQWDRTLIWLIESGNKTKEEIVDSINWGNYRNSELTYKNNNGTIITKKSGEIVKIPTGSTEYTKANNIYDLAGNVSDWDMEANTNMHRVLKGGNYQDLGHSACDRAVYHPIGGFNQIRLSSNALYKINQ